MTPILSAAAEIQGFCQREGWSFCIVGGLAVLRWGKPRTTQDVDLTLITGFGAEESFVDKLLAHFRMPSGLPCKIVSCCWLQPPA